MLVPSSIQNKLNSLNNDSRNLGILDTKLNGLNYSKKEEKEAKEKEKEGKEENKDLGNSN